MTPQDNKAKIERVIREAWNNGNLAAIDETVAPDYLGHDPNYPQPIAGPEGFKQWLMTARTAFPDFHLDVDFMLAEGDNVAMRLTMTGTNTGPLMGMPPTGKAVKFTGSSLRRFAGGKMIEGWDQTDMFGLLLQLGLMSG